jgi:hypothetical protein
MESTTTTNETTLTILKDARSFETAHEAKNYPYGFRLRTSMFSWIEHTKHGARLVQQTINPKNGKLNAPKKSTYGRFKLLALNHEDHVCTVGYGDYSEAEGLEKFLVKYSSFMSEGEIKDAQALIKVKSFISKKFEEMDKEIKEKIYLPVESIEAGQIIPKKNLLDYSGRAELYEIVLAGNALKARCRKETRERLTLAYIKAGEQFTHEQALELKTRLNPEILNALNDFKTHNFKLVFEKVNFSNEGNTMFHSISRMLFSSEKFAIEL